MQWTTVYWAISLPPLPVPTSVFLIIPISPPCYLKVLETGYLNNLPIRIVLYLS